MGDTKTKKGRRRRIDMTEQDVHNTLHSFNVIKQLQTSGQSFEDFFEENKDFVKNEYSHEFKFLY